MQKERGPAIEAPFLFDELRMIHAKKDSKGEAFDCMPDSQAKNRFQRRSL